MSSKKGSSLLEEHKRKISKALLGHKVSQETRNKISLFHKGRMNGRLGKKHTEEAKRKMSLSHKGKKLTEEHKRKLSISHQGAKSCLWRGGISFEPYGLEFNENLKEVIRNRDRRKCQICEKTELENKRRLQIHHIDYNKRNNNPNNLISLCLICHMKTNHNRDYWNSYFMVSK